MSLCLFSPSISLLPVPCFMLCRALGDGKEGIVLKNIRLFWLKDTKLICFTDPGSVLSDNCTPLNKQGTHGQIYHIDHQTLVFCSLDCGVSFAIRECEFGTTHVTTSCFFTNLPCRTAHIEQGGAEEHSTDHTVDTRHHADHCWRLSYIYR